MSVSNLSHRFTHMNNIMKTKDNNINIHIIDTHDKFSRMYNMISDESAISNYMNETNITHFIGLDIEFVNMRECNCANVWIPNKDVCILPCIIQIMTGENCYIIELKKLGNILPKKLIKIISCSSWIKMGVNCSQDVKILSLAYNLGQCSGAIDIDRICVALSLPDISLNGIYKYITGITGKEKQMSIRDWTKDLSHNAITYAANDAIMSYVVGNYFLMNKLENIPLFNVNDNTITSIKLNSNISENYVGLLNEYCQQNQLEFPEYMYRKSLDGFTCICNFNNNSTYTGMGNNKKRAKQEASKIAISNIMNYSI